MKIEITLELHHEKGTNFLLLDSQDVFNFIGETTKAETQLFYYLDKWCEWLNYYFTHNSTCNGNIEEAQLRSWISGYNYAKQIDEQEFDDRYVLVMRGYVITIYKPHEINSLDALQIADKITCGECEYLMFSDCYGECSKAYKGIVGPDDSCGKGKRR